MKILPYKLPPFEDESPTSWILRLANKYHCDVRTFLEYYKCSDLLRSALDIDADLSELKRFLPLGHDLPKTLSAKIIHLQWTKGRSPWMDPNNRKGSTALNSKTAICLNCLTEKGYYQLKWKVSIIKCCVKCRCLLVNRCPSCKKMISLHQLFKNWKHNYTSKQYLNCSRCGFKISQIETIKVDLDLLNQQLKVTKAFLEEPPNYEFLYYTLGDQRF